MVKDIERSAEERKRLDDIAEEHGVSDFIDYLPSEIELIESARLDKDCGEYALITPEVRNYLPHLFPEIEEPEEGDFVLYYSKEEGILHVGIYQGDGSVISKWGTNGPVLEHPIDLVPLSYGESYLFLRIPERKLEMLRKPDAIFDIMSYLDDLI